MIAEIIEKELKKKGTKERARVCASFFKTGKGQYGEGDVFLGVTVPDTRVVVKAHMKELTLGDACLLLESKFHESRLAGVIVFTLLFEKATKENNTKEQKKIFETYLAMSHRINNWDLVDVSCSRVVGVYLLDKKRDILYTLAKSKNLWEKRIAIVSTFAFIRQGQYQDTFKLSEMLLTDKHDLMHKAVGWMLREVGKNCGQETLNMFLEKHADVMPRTALRYSLERHHPVHKAKFMARG